MEKLAMPRRDICSIAGEKPILYYKSAAIPQQFERKGVMPAIVEDILREAQQAGYGSLFGSAWLYDGKIPLQGTLKKLGFQALYARKMLWYDDVNYHCVICKGRCTCDAMLYCRKIGGEGL